MAPLMPKLGMLKGLGSVVIFESSGFFGSFNRIKTKLVLREMKALELPALKRHETRSILEEEFAMWATDDEIQAPQSLVKTFL